MTRCPSFGPLGWSEAAPGRGQRGRRYRDGTGPAAAAVRLCWTDDTARRSRDGEADTAAARALGVGYSGDDTEPAGSTAPADRSSMAGRWRVWDGPLPETPTVLRR